MFQEPIENTVLSISELGEFVKSALGASFGSEGLWVKGVVASYSAHSSGHHYLDLQEYSELGSAAPVATVSCVIWKARASLLVAQLNATPLAGIRNGLSLVARVKPNLWPKGGRLSFQIEEIDIALSQIANLQEKEKIRAKLRKLGIWDHNRKLEPPLVPLKVGLVTALGSAAESDFIGELARSGFAFKVTYRPASTAGEAAPAQISRSISLFQDSEVDLICLVRGGGSMSDLSVFDTEEVVTAVAASSLPVWVGVGHSTDTTLVEEVANRFLDVPQSVARALVARVQEFLDELSIIGRRVHSIGRTVLEVARLQLTESGHQAVRKPLELIHYHTTRISQQSERLRTAAVVSTSSAATQLSTVAHRILVTAQSVASEQARQVDLIAHLPKSSSQFILLEHAHLLEILESSTRASDPEEMAKRGFSLLATDSGTLIKSVEAISVGQRLKGMIGRSSFDATVDKVRNEETGGRDPDA